MTDGARTCLGWLGGAMLAWRTGEAVGMDGTVQSNDTVLKVTGRDVVLNGIAEIPRAMFSVHATPLDAARVEEWGVEGIRRIHHRPSGIPSASDAPFVLECCFDRYQPATLLVRSDWEAHLAKIARDYGNHRASAPAPQSWAIEFWNEPYLNWATKPGVNYDGIHFNLAEAGPEAPVVSRFGNEVLTNLVWDAQVTVAFRYDLPAPPSPAELAQLELAGDIDYLAMRFMPPSVVPGEIFRWREQPYVAGRRWWVRDKSQATWWSGTVNRDWYLRMATVFAKELKAADPGVPFVAGWGFHLFESNWRSWDLLHRPTLDALHPWVDGYGEHHYGVDPRRVAASYEIADAYMRSRWNRRIGFWNTEAGGMQDPERPDSLKPLPQGNAPDQARGAAAYFLRDVLTMLRHVPDKARMRCAHEPQVNSGVPAAFRLLKPLRGALLETTCPDNGVFAVAARTEDRLTLACYNSTATPQTRQIEVNAPAGASLTSLERLRIVEREGLLDIESTPGTATGTRWSGTTTLPPSGAETLVFAIAGTPRPTVVRREQYVGDAILQEVAAGKPATFRIALPAEALAAASRASVRWVIAGANATLKLQCNGHPLSPAPATGPFRDLPVGKDLLRPDTVLEFDAEGWESTVVGTASVWLESDAPARVESEP